MCEEFAFFSGIVAIFLIIFLILISGCCSISHSGGSGSSRSSSGICNYNLL